MVKKLVKTPYHHKKEDVDRLIEQYKESIQDFSDGANNVQATLLEYVDTFNTRGLDGFNVVLDKIAVVGRKDVSKRTLNYLVGCLRNIMENGLTSTGSSNESRLLSTFQEIYNLSLGVSGREKILSMMTRYGIVELLFTILENKQSLEDIVLSRLEDDLLKNTKS